MSNMTLLRLLWFILQWRKGLDTSLKIPFQTLMTQQKLEDISVFL